MLDLDTRKRIRPLLVGCNDKGPGAWWRARREELKAVILEYVGRPPLVPHTPELRVVDEVEAEDYRHFVVAYDVAPGEEVRAHLLVPEPSRRLRGAAVLCLHGTAAEAKDTQIGKGDKRNRDFGRVLARHGFITLSPDHVCAGERLLPGYAPYDTAPFYARYPDWSAVGKAIWDGQRAIDVLVTLDEVDPDRIGAVGHSLGGHGALFVAAFDERVRATVSSCGLTTWAGNPKRLNWAREEWYSYLPKLRDVFIKDRDLPFDLHEFAALVAPRALLNISGMADPIYGNNETLPEVGLQLQALYERLGHSDRFANFLFGGGHDVPDYSMTLIVAWLKDMLTA